MIATADDSLALGTHGAALFSWRRCLVSLALVLSLSGCAWLPFGGGEIRFSHEQLGARLAKRFPMERSVAGLLDVTLSNPRFETRESGGGNRLAASFDMVAKMSLTGKSISGSMTLSGIPRYDAKLQSIFLDNARVEALRSDHMPEALAAALAKTATSVARDALEEKALYAFSPEELRRYGLSLSPKRIEVRQDGIALIL